MTKAFSFFNGKGGVGKTTLTILFASFLAYARHLRVKVIDFDNPDYRRQDEFLLSTEGTPLYNYALRNEMPSSAEYFQIEESGPSVGEYSTKAVKKLTSALSEDKESGQNDVILVDFPADYADGIPVDAVAKAGLLDLVYIPMSTEQQERRSACKTALGLSESGVHIKLLWNRVDRDILKRSERLDLAEAQIRDRYHLDYSPVRIPSFRKAAQGTGDPCFVRSTVCWPEKYIMKWCPEINKLFKEITSLLGV